MEAKTGLLKLGDGPQVEVSDEHQLRSLLEPLGKLVDGQVVTLRRDKSDFIKATRHGQLWSVTAKRGRMWTARSFTAEITSEYSQRQAREGRQHRSLRSWFRWRLRSPPP